MNVETEHKNGCGCQHQSDHMQNETASAKVMLALLPCGLRNAFIQTLQVHFPEIMDNENYVIDGNLNYEKSFYDSLNEGKSVDALPDIFISSDINNVYYKSFIDSYLNDNYFDSIACPASSFFEKENFVHPTGHLSWFTANLLVIVADLDKVHEDLLPVSWADLLNEYFKNSVTLRGDVDFFCNAALFPFFKDYGSEAITQLGRNTAQGLHPSQMIKTINAGNDNGTALYVMPYSFALKIRNQSRFQMIFPAEGPIVSPVQMMIKKGTYLRNKELVDYILGDEMAQTLQKNGFPSLNGNLPDLKNLNWIGWDYIISHDIASVKDEIQNLFFAGFQPV